MQKRSVRFSLLALLLTVGAGVGIAAWDIERRTQLLEDNRQDADSHIDRLISDVAGIAAAQRAYVAPGQPAEPSIDLVSRLIQQISTDADALGPRTRSVDAAGHLEAFRGGITGLTLADTGIRERLRVGELRMATDLIFGDAREILGTMDTALRKLQAAEAAAFVAERAARARQSWMLIGAIALLWALGLIALVRMPAAAGAPVDTALPAPVVKPSPAHTPVESPVDLVAAAELCTAISRATTTTSLPALLQGAAAILGARGIILWMGAGEELVAAASQGYAAHVISRLGAIERTAENATAAAWRTCQMQTVAGSRTTLGAIVAPLFAGETCIGVLAVEVPPGREDDHASRAVTTMIAAQLAAAVAAWPEPGKKIEGENLSVHA
jgi:hypothetical protein